MGCFFSLEILFFEDEDNLNYVFIYICCKLRIACARHPPLASMKREDGGLKKKTLHVCTFLLHAS